MALLLLAAPLMPQHRAAWSKVCGGDCAHLLASQGAAAADSAASDVPGRVDVLIPYSPDDRGVFLTDDPARGALASALRYISDLRTVFVVANQASRQELEPVLRDRRVVFVDEDSILPKGDMRGWHYQQVRRLTVCKYRRRTCTAGLWAQRV